MQTITFEDCTLAFYQQPYAQGGKALCLEDVGGPEPYAVLSVWVPTTPTLPENVFYPKDWAEHAALVAALVEQGALTLATEFPAQAAGYIMGIRAYQFIPPPLA